MAVDNAARRLLRLLGEVLARQADAIDRCDEARARWALNRLFAIRENLNALIASINLAHSSRRWSLRGRLAAHGVTETIALYDRRAIRLFASAILLGEAAANALRRGDPPPAWFVARLRQVAAVCTAIGRRAAEQPSLPEPAIETLPTTHGWESSVHYLRVVELSLAALKRAQGGADGASVAERSVSQAQSRS
jgi:hypothetical protein